MHSFTLNYGAYAFTVFPNIAITRRELDPASEGAGVLETWTVTGILRGANPLALEQARADAETAFASDGQIIAFKQGATLLRAIDTADCRVTPHVAEVRWNASGTAEFHGEFRFTVIFEAVLELNDDVIQASETTITQSEDVAGRVTITTNGSATLRVGTTEDIATNALTPAIPVDMRRIASRVVILPDWRVSFSFTDEEMFKMLPSGVRDGHYTRSSARDEQGRLAETIAGFFIGEQAIQRALELRPQSSRLLNEAISENAFERRVDFRFEMLPLTGSDELLRSTEYVTFAETRNFVDHKLKIPMGETYRQEVGGPDVRVTQEGSALGIASHPMPPAPLYPDAVIEREVRYSSPVEGGQTPLETRWRFVCAPLGAVKF